MPWISISLIRGSMIRYTKRPSEKFVQEAGDACCGVLAAGSERTRANCFTSDWARKKRLVVSRSSLARLVHFILSSNGSAYK
jgi:hypothetical protein